MTQTILDSIVEETQTKKRFGSKFKRNLALGLGGLVGLLGVCAITPKAEAAPGDHYGRTLVSETEKITGVSYSLNDNITWMNHSGALRQASYNTQSSIDPSL